MGGDAEDGPPCEGEVYLLFDVQNDPGEARNLAGLPEYAEIERALRLGLLERLVAAQFPAPVNVNELALPCRNNRRTFSYF